MSTSMTVQQLMSELQSLIAEDPKAANMNIRVTVFTQSGYVKDMSVGDVDFDDDDMGNEASIYALCVPTAYDLRDMSPVETYVWLRCVELEESPEYISPLYQEDGPKDS